MTAQINRPVNRTVAGETGARGMSGRFEVRSPAKTLEIGYLHLGGRLAIYKLTAIYSRTAGTGTCVRAFFITYFFFFLLFFNLLRYAREFSTAPRAARLRRRFIISRKFFARAAKKSRTRHAIHRKNA